MKSIFHSLYARISAVFLLLLLAMGVTIALVSMQASLNFVLESDQRLNRSLARDLAKELLPFLSDSLDFEGIDHQIHHLMVMNPRVEIYLLNDDGKILAFFAEPEKKVKQNRVDLAPIQEYLSHNAEILSWGEDPRNPGSKKPFSADRIAIGQRDQGYLYVILASEQFDTAAAMIRESYIVRTTLVSLAIIIIFTAITGLVLFAFLTKKFRAMTEDVKRFERGDLSRRISLASKDEIGELAKAFNQMADTIVANLAELKKTDDLRRELIANVSHDLRSPLASIQGYLETTLMKDQALSAKQRREYLTIVLDNTKLLSKLVHELFELSKLDAKQVQPKIERFSLPELTQDVVMKFKPQADKMNVRLAASLAQDLPMVQADIGMIERALSNLIDNALRYTPAQGEVRVNLTRPTGKKIRVEVSDTGCGIPEENLPYVFERFYRVDKSRARDSGGVGLGLAIAKRIIDLHCGALAVKSTVNAGTTLWFELQAG